MQTIAAVWVVFICLAIRGYGRRVQSEDFSPRREARKQAGEEQSRARLLAAFDLGAGFQVNAAPRTRPHGSSAPLQQPRSKSCDVVTRAPAGVMQFGEGQKLEAETKAAKRRLKEAEDVIGNCEEAERVARQNVEEKEESFAVLKLAFDKARQELYNAQYDLTQAEDAREESIMAKEDAVKALEDARAAEYTWLEENALEAAANAGAKAAASAAGALGSGLLTGIFGEPKSVREAKAKQEKKTQQKLQKEGKAPTKEKAPTETKAPTESKQPSKAEQSKKEKSAKEQRKDEEDKTDAEEVKVEPKGETSTESQVESGKPSPGEGLSDIDKELVQKREEALKLLKTRRARTLTDSLAAAAGDSLLGVGGSLTQELRDKMKQEAKEEEKRFKYELFESDWDLFGLTVDDAVTTGLKGLKKLYIKRMAYVHPDAIGKDPEDPEVKKLMQQVASAAQVNAAYETLRDLVLGKLGPGQANE